MIQSEEIARELVTGLQAKGCPAFLLRGSNGHCMVCVGKPSADLLASHVVFVPKPKPKSPASPPSPPVRKAKRLPNGLTPRQAANLSRLESLLVTSEHLPYATISMKMTGNGRE